MAEEKDQGTKETEEKGQSEGEQSPEESTKTSPKEDVYSLVKGLQKGYTLTRQELAEMREQLQEIVDRINQKTGAEEGDEEYITVGKLREILMEEYSRQIAESEEQKTRAEKYVSEKLADFRSQGLLSSQDEEDKFVSWAVNKKLSDLDQAIERWVEIKQAREEGMKSSEKTRARQEEGSKVGTSSKTTEEQGGVDLKKVRQMDWFSF